MLTTKQNFGKVIGLCAALALVSACGKKADSGSGKFTPGVKAQSSSQDSKATSNNDPNAVMAAFKVATEEVNLDDETSKLYLNAAATGISSQPSLRLAGSNVDAFRAAANGIADYSMQPGVDAPELAGLLSQHAAGTLKADLTGLFNSILPKLGNDAAARFIAGMPLNERSRFGAEWLARAKQASEGPTPDGLLNLCNHRGPKVALNVIDPTMSGSNYASMMASQYASTTSSTSSGTVAATGASSGVAPASSSSSSSYSSTASSSGASTPPVSAGIGSGSYATAAGSGSSASTPSGPVAVSGGAATPPSTGAPASGSASSSYGSGSSVSTSAGSNVSQPLAASNMPGAATSSSSSYTAGAAGSSAASSSSSVMPNSGAAGSSAASNGNAASAQGSSASNSNAASANSANSASSRAAAAGDADVAASDDSVPTDDGSLWGRCPNPAN